MRLGLGSYALAWNIGVPGCLPKRPMDAFGFVEFAAQHDFSLVQVADNLPLAGLPARTLGRLKALVQSLELDVEVGTRGIRDGNLERYLEVAQFFGSPLLRVVVDTTDHHPSLAEVERTLRSVLPLFESAGVTLAVENHDRFSAKSLAGLITALDSVQLGVCLDTVNSFGALEGPGVVVETLGPFVVNLHVKDFVVERAGHNMGFTISGTPAGRGMLNLSWLTGRLTEMGRDTNLILELWPAPETTVDATLEKEVQWVVESAAYLRRFLLP